MLLGVMGWVGVTAISPQPAPDNQLLPTNTHAGSPRRGFYAKPQFRAARPIETARKDSGCVAFPLRSYLVLSGSAG